MEKDKNVDIKMCSWFSEHWYKIQFEDGTIDYYPSATTKLSELGNKELLRWYGDVGTREAQKRMKEGGDKGSRIHHGAQIMVQGGAVIYNPMKHPNYTGEEISKMRKKYNEVYVLEDQAEMLDIWKIKKLFSILKCQIIGTEFIVYSIKNREAGTVDLALRFKEDGVYEGINSKPIKIEAGIWLADYKTGNLYDKANMQLADYGEMYLEMSSKEIGELYKGALLIHTGSKTRTGIPGLALVLLDREQLKEDYSDFRHTAAMWARKNKNAAPRLLEFPALLTMEDTKEVEK